MSLLAAVAAAASLVVSPPHLLAAPKCPIFPANNPWNRRVDSLPVAANSAQIIQSIGADTGLHADFGSGTYDGAIIGIPFNVVSARQPKQRIVKFEYALAGTTSRPAGSGTRSASRSSGRAARTSTPPGTTRAR